MYLPRVLRNCREPSGGGKLLGVLACTTMGSPSPHGCSATPWYHFRTPEGPGTWVVATQLRFGLLPASLHWWGRVCSLEVVCTLEGSGCAYFITGHGGGKRVLP